MLPGQGQDENALAASISKVARSYAGERAPVGVLINKHDRGVAPETLVARMRDAGMTSLPLIGIIPREPRLLAPRLSDIVRALDLEVVHVGSLETSRVRDIVVAAAGAETCIRRLKPGVRWLSVIMIAAILLLRRLLPVKEGFHLPAFYDRRVICSRRVLLIW